MVNEPVQKINTNHLEQEIPVKKKYFLDFSFMLKMATGKIKIKKPADKKASLKQIVFKETKVC